VITVATLDGQSTSGQLPNVAYNSDNIAFRHGGNTCIRSYLDGHVECSANMPELFPMAGMQVWFNADNVKANDGDKVNVLQDMSGTHHDATPYSSSAVPTYSTNKQNKQPVVNFNGTPMRFDYVGEPVTVVLAGLDNLTSKPTSGGHTWIGGYSRSAGNFGAYYFRPAHQAGYASFDRRLSTVAGGGVANGTCTLTLNQFVVLSSRINENGYVDMFINNANKVTGGTPLTDTRVPIEINTVNSTTTKETVLGGGYWNDNPGDNIAGYLGQVMMFDVPLTDQELDAVDKYLMRKYGVN
ncbi:MAG TPA: hypothetical protein VHV83_12310, partial [Armatimonadota bacterium]|nr:hypothetical protein [Armatimonadota bacterium]